MSNKTTEEKLDLRLKDSLLIQFLGEENVKDMKRRVVDVIVDRVREDLSDYCEFLIDPDNIVECLMDDTIDRVQDRVQEKLEKVVLERAMKKLGLDVSEVCE